jgi:hypothetical protein
MAEGGQGTDPTTWCLSPGMPRVTNGYGVIEFVITPETFHILVDHVHDKPRSRDAVDHCPIPKVVPDDVLLRW